MGQRRKDLTGLKVGFLTVLEPSESVRGQWHWLTRCACGAEKSLNSAELTKWHKRGAMPSCGCMRKVTIGRRNTRHGMSGHPAYAVWRSMLDRCRLPTHQAWPNYGGRGVKVCERWTEFSLFWDDMGPRYRTGYDIERLDNSKGYSPENCAWRTRQRNASNRRTNHYLETPSGRITVSQAARRYGVNRTTLLYRLDMGQTVEQALNIQTSMT